MKRLKAYKQAVADLEFAKETVIKLDEQLKAYDTVTVGTSITINASSSDKQFVYATGILYNQIKACKELGLDSAEYKDAKTNIIQIRTISKELREWVSYAEELQRYTKSIHSLLDKDELFSLLEKPVMPK